MIGIAEVKIDQMLMELWFKADGGHLSDQMHETSIELRKVIMVDSFDLGRYGNKIQS